MTTYKLTVIVDGRQVATATESMAKPLVVLRDIARDARETYGWRVLSTNPQLMSFEARHDDGRSMRVFLTREGA